MVRMFHTTRSQPPGGCGIRTYFRTAMSIAGSWGLRSYHLSGWALWVYSWVAIIWGRDVLLFLVSPELPSYIVRKLYVYPPTYIRFPERPYIYRWRATEFFGMTIISLIPAVSVDATVPVEDMLGEGDLYRLDIQLNNQRPISVVIYYCWSMRGSRAHRQGLRVKLTTLVWASSTRQDCLLVCIDLNSFPETASFSEALCCIDTGRGCDYF